MPRYQVKTAWCLPEQTRIVVGADGRDHVERIPNHPTRRAYAGDWNTWWEDVDEAAFFAAMRDGASVRVR